MTVVSDRMHGVRSVAVGFWVGIGARDEAPNEAGASHFLEHLLFKGTPTRSATAIAEAIDEVGGDLNAFTTKEYTAFEVRLLADHFDVGLEILCDIMWSPAFRDDEVEAERSVILEEILMTQDEPGDLVHDLFAESLFRAHPLGRSVLGTEESIEAMERDAISSFHDRHYWPGQIVVAAAGDVEHEHLCRILDAIAPVTRKPAPAREHPPANEPRRRVEPRETEQAHLIMGVRTAGALDDDRFALEVISQAMGGGISSRLFQQVREQRGLAYSVYSYRSAYNDAGLLAFYAATTLKNTDALVELFNEAFESLADGLSERELAIAKGQIRGSTLLGLEDSGARMARIGRTQLVHGHVIEIDELLRRVDAVTLDDIARVGRGVASSPRVLTAIGPFKETVDDSCPGTLRA